jgi:hypothetical protein
MCFDINPLTHQLHTKKLEAELLAQSYDHSKPQLYGWRAERKLAALADRRSDQNTRMNAPAKDADSTSPFWVRLFSGWRLSRSG